MMKTIMNDVFISLAPKEVEGREVERKKEDEKNNIKQVLCTVLRSLEIT
jgi:hypothetical protein